MIKGKKKGKRAFEQAAVACGLSEEEAMMARAVGFDPRGLLKHIDSRDALVRRIRELYVKRAEAMAAAECRRKERKPREPEPDYSYNGPECDYRWYEEEYAPPAPDIADEIASALADQEGVDKIIRYGAAAQGRGDGAPPALAVWLTGFSRLGALRRAFETAPDADLALFDAATDDYAGHLCNRAACPESAPECKVAGCGAHAFLRRIEGFSFKPGWLAPDKAVILCGNCSARRDFDFDDLPF